MMKTLTKSLAIVAIAISPLLSHAQVAPGAGDVLISELTRFDVAYDYLELYNNTNNNITLANCKLIRFSGTTVSYIYDFGIEGSGDIIVPANGFLILSDNVTKSNFNSRWSIDVDAMGVSFNQAYYQAFGGARTYALKYSGTANTNDGTLIDSSLISPASPRRYYQAPIGNGVLQSTSTLTDFTPGSFGLSDDFTTWDGIYSSSVWSGLTPSGSTGSSNFLVHGAGAVIANGSILNDLYICENSSINNTTQSVTVNGNLTMKNGSAFRISSSSGSLTVLGSTSISIIGLGNANGYNIWSSPFSNSPNILNTFSGVNPCDVYVFRASGQSWAYDYSVPFSTTCNGSAVTFTSANVISFPQGTADGNFDVGRGYFAPGDVNGTRTFTSSSNPTNGTINVSLYGSSISLPDGNDWNLIGNPYIAGVSVYRLIAQNSSLFNAIYIYNGATGSYETKTSASGYTIALGQGFWVDANSTTDGVIGTMSFTNLQQRNYYNSFSKTDGNGVDTTIAFISLNNSNNNLKDQIQIFLDPDCEDGYDNKFDARKLWNDNNLNFATLIETDPIYGPRPYAINGIKSLEDKESKVLDLLVQTDASSNYEIKLDSLRDMPQGISIFLEDNLTSTMTDLRTNSYTFNSPQSDSLENRFFLHFSYDANITSTNEVGINGVLSIYTQQESIEVKSISKNVEIDNVQVYDILGKLMVSNNSKGTSISISTTSFNTGTYIVRAVNNNGEIYNKRIFVK